MRMLRVFALLNIVLGLAIISLPLEFYGVMKEIFDGLSPPPFDFAIVRKFIFILGLPAMVFFLNAIMLLLIERETITKVEVITQSGRLLGRARRIKMRREALERVHAIETTRGEEIKREDILSAGENIIVRAREEELNGKEVYSDAGEFLGNVVEKVSYEGGKATAIKVQKKDNVREIPLEDIEMLGEVILVKARD